MRSHREFVRSAVRHALSFSLALPAASMLLGCTECSDDSEQTSLVTLPLVRCDGVVVVGAETCPSTARSTDYALPDGGNSTSYYEARTAWLSAPCAAACGAAGHNAVSCRFTDDAAGRTALECTVRYEGGCHVTAPGKGRRPAGFSGSTRDADDLPTFLVAMGELEDASVPSFRRLKSDLANLGAPRRLRRAAGRAAREERRHTRAAFAFARRVGASPRRACVSPPSPRSLEAIAIENAVEGCVHELHGAAVAAWAAARARDPHMRAMMSRVAEEEASHAALGFELVRWFDTKLGAAARGRVRDAARVAVATLTHDVPSFPRLADAGVVPSREQHRALLEHLRTNVWDDFTDRRSRARPATAHQGKGE